MKFLVKVKFDNNLFTSENTYKQGTQINYTKDRNAID